MSYSQILPILGNPALSAYRLDYAAQVAAGAIWPEFGGDGMEGDFSFDIGPPGVFASRISPVVLDTTGRTVTLQNNAAGRYLQTEAGRNGLIGPTQDAREMTYAALYNYRNPSPASSWQMIAGTFTDVAADGGEQLVVNSDGNIQATSRGFAGSSAQVNFGELVSQGFPSNNSDLFIFVALTSRLTGVDDATAEQTLFVGMPDRPVTSIRSGVKTLGARKLALGNAYRSNAAYIAMPGRFARFYSGRGGRTVDQLTGMYRRAKVIAARRGIRVF